MAGYFSDCVLSFFLLVNGLYLYNASLVLSTTLVHSHTHTHSCRASGFSVLLKDTLLFRLEERWFVDDLLFITGKTAVQGFGNMTTIGRHVLLGFQL